MSTELSRTGPPSRRPPLKNRNVIMFPRELRDAIPDLPTYTGRLLQLESIDGSVIDNPLFGKSVSVQMVVAETGKLKGKFTVKLGLLPDAARALAETLVRLADQLEK